MVNYLVQGIGLFYGWASEGLMSVCRSLDCTFLYRFAVLRIILDLFLEQYLALIVIDCVVV